MTVSLTAAQVAALAAVRARGGTAKPVLGEAAALVRDHASVVLNFHPYRRMADGRTVADGLLADGVYRGQYETGTGRATRG